MAKKQEFKLNFYKDANDAWSASAFFVNDDSNKQFVISACAGPHESAKTAKPYVKERLELRVKEFLIDNPRYRRVDYEEFANFRE